VRQDAQPGSETAGSGHARPWRRGHAAVRVVRKHTWMQGTMGRRHDATAHLGCAGEEVLLGDDGVDVEKKSSSVTVSRRARDGVRVGQN
jgi:hypothetical protein